MLKHYGMNAKKFQIIIPLFGNILITWKKQESKQLDQRTRKLLTMNTSVSKQPLWKKIKILHNKKNTASTQSSANGSPPVAQAYFECNVAVYKNGKKAIDT